MCRITIVTPVMWSEADLCSRSLSELEERLFSCLLRGGQHGSTLQRAGQIYISRLPLKMVYPPDCNSNKMQIVGMTYTHNTIGL